MLKAFNTFSNSHKIFFGYVSVSLWQTYRLFNEGVEEGGVKVNLFRKNTIGLKVIGAGNFMFAKNVLKKIYKYSSYIPSKCFSFKVLHLLPGLQVKPKFQIVTSLFDTNHGRGSSEGTFATNISLVLPV